MIEVAKPQKSNEWYTPSRYIEAARLVMGGIDLDPASCELANQTVKASRYYSKEDNGLSKPWYGNIWLNPPFSSVGPWVRRLVREYEEGQVKQGILLVPNDSTVRWYFLLWDFIISLPQERIIFTRPGRNADHPRFSTVFTYLGPHEQKFIDTFSQFGRIAKAIDTPPARIKTPELWEVSA